MTKESTVFVSHAGELRVEVFGAPVPQGSMRGIPIRGRRFGTVKVAIVHGSEKLGPWRRMVGMKARDAANRQGWRLATGPLEMELSFRFWRAKSCKDEWPSQMKRLDLDKLQRAVFDALTGVAYADDAQVIRVRAEKKWAVGDEYAGCSIVLRRV